MIIRLTRATLLVTLVLLSGVSLGREVSAAELVRIQDLVMAGEGDGRFRLSVRSSGPLPTSSCRIGEGANASWLVLELPGAESGLKPAYDFPGMPVGTIRVSPLGGPGGAGVKIEVPLAGATLQGWEATAEGMVLLLTGSPAPPASPVRGPYRLGVGDRLEISVFGHEDMRQDLEVLADGTVALPMVGVVPVAGKTVSELRGELEAKLKDYLVDPQVSLDIKDYKSQSVNVVGEVKNPGQYYLKGSTTLVDIIALAGWMTANAGGEVILTRRETDPAKGTQLRQIVVLKENLVGSEQVHNNPLVQGGDVVSIGPKQYFYIRGEIVKPGQYPLEDHPTLMKAISIAQGLTQFARKKGIEVIRMVNGVQTKMEVDLKAIEEHKVDDVPLLADDQILVPRKRF
jgi:polysaccharide export outer membrane protein